jgi:predicted DNA-binding ribbon-helix-helix protein
VNPKQREPMTRDATRIKSRVAKRSVKINGRKTSVSLEDGFWSALKEIASTQRTTTQDLVLNIDKRRVRSNLSSAIRVYVLGYYYDRHDAKA